MSNTEFTNGVTKICAEWLNVVNDFVYGLIDADKVKGVTIDDADIGDGKVLEYNATSGNLEYTAAAAGGGDVSKVGTPVNNQVGVWTGDGTIEGDTALTFDTATDTLSTVNIAPSGIVDGRDIATDGTKLDGIEAGADVTDTTNVTTAGALMDSELTNLSGVKTLTVPDSTTISTFGASIIDDANEAAFKATVNLEIGTDVAPQEVTINAQTGTTYTTILADNGKLVTLSNASAITLTIPTNASVAYPVGTTIAFQQIGAGLVTMSGAGVTFNNRNGLVSGGQYAMWSITKTDTDTWAVAGDLTT